MLDKEIGSGHKRLVVTGTRDTAVDLYRERHGDGVPPIGRSDRVARGKDILQIDMLRMEVGAVMHLSGLGAVGLNYQFLYLDRGVVHIQLTARLYNDLRDGLRTGRIEFTQVFALAIGNHIRDGRFRFGIRIRFRIDLCGRGRGKGHLSGDIGIESHVQITVLVYSGCPVAQILCADLVGQIIVFEFRIRDEGLVVGRSDSAVTGYHHFA